MAIIRIALASVRAPRGIDDSVAIAEDAIAQAARERAAIVCFPECLVPGYRWPGRSMPPLDMPALENAWARIARAAADSRIAVILGTERLFDGHPRITVVVFDADGRTLGFQDKVQIDPSEGSFYSPGPVTERRVFETAGVKFGVAICHEGFRYPETVRAAARGGAQIVFHPYYDEPELGGYKPTTYGEPANSFHEKAALCRAAENTVYVASVNNAFPGAAMTSAIVKPDGSLLAWQPYGKDGLLVADLDLTAATGLFAKRFREPVIV